MIEGTTIRLRAWREDDIPSMMSLRNDVELQSKLLARVQGSNQSQVRQWLEGRSNTADSLLFMIADVTDDSALGYIQIVDMHPVDHRGELGICLSPQSQGKHIGQETLQLILPYLRDSRALRKVTLRVDVDNRPAIRCYEKVGFAQCGLLRSHTFILGAWIDVAIMDIFLSEEN